jgi:hypothetical protein
MSIKVSVSVPQLAAIWDRAISTLKVTFIWVGNYWCRLAWAYKVHLVPKVHQEQTEHRDQLAQPDPRVQSGL